MAQTVRKTSQSLKSLAKGNLGGNPFCDFLFKVLPFVFFFGFFITPNLFAYTVVVGIWLLIDLFYFSLKIKGFEDNTAMALTKGINKANAGFDNYMLTSDRFVQEAIQSFTYFDDLRFKPKRVLIARQDVKHLDIQLLEEKYGYWAVEDFYKQLNRTTNTSYETERRQAAYSVASMAYPKAFRMVGTVEHVFEMGFGAASLHSIYTETETLPIAENVKVSS